MLYYTAVRCHTSYYARGSIGWDGDELTSVEHIEGSAATSASNTADVQIFCPADSNPTATTSVGNREATLFSLMFADRGHPQSL
jgi:hypothetical protein